MFILSPSMYEFMKKLVQVFLPAFSSAYFALADVWDLPAAEKVVGTIAIVCTFLGVCLGISTSTYRKINDLNAGDLVVESDEEGSTFRLVLNAEPEEFNKMQSIRFNVVRRPLQAEQ